MTQPELEIGLHRRDAFMYTVDLRYVSSTAGTDEWVTGEARLDFDRLRSMRLDDVAYGSELTKSLFGDQAIRIRFSEVLKATEAQDDPLRLRLFIGPTAPELQTLRWERLRDPESDSPLFTKHRVHFSRYLSSRDWRPTRCAASGARRRGGGDTPGLAAATRSASTSRSSGEPSSAGSSSSRAVGRRVAARPSSCVEHRFRRGIGTLESSPESSW